MAERLANGRFAPGHKINKGRPSNGGRPRRSVEERYLKSMRSAVTVKDWREIVVRALIDAKVGDKAAREWLSNYLLGRPDQYTKLDVDADVIMRIEETENWRGNGQNDNGAQAAPGPKGDIPPSGEVQVAGLGQAVAEDDAGRESGA